MNEENNGQPQVGTADPQSPQVGIPESSAPVADPQPTLTLEQALDALRKARNEAASHRVKLNEYEEKARRDAEAQMTEAQKYQSRAADLERQVSELTRTHQERAIKYEVQLHAAKLGIIDPDAASKLLDYSQLEYDDDGTPKNAGKLFQDLVKAKPYLAGTPQSGSVANPPRQTNQTTFTQAQISSMSPDEYRKNRAAIFAAQREGRIIG